MISVKPSRLNILNTMTKSKFMEKYFYKLKREDAAKFAGQMALISAISKDAVNCAYYYTQSKNNEKIPEDKRGFVASLDLMNGILNVGLQLSIGEWIKNKNPEWFKKIMGKHLDTNKTIEVAKKLEDSLKGTHPQENISINQIETYLKDKKILGLTGKKIGWLGAGFSALSVLVGTQVIIKRVFTPLIATPLAGWYKDNYLEKNKLSGQKNKVKPGDKPEMSDAELQALVYKPWEHSSNGDKTSKKKSLFA